MSDPEVQELKELFIALDEKFIMLDKKITPMVEAYDAAIKLGVWAKYLLWFVATFLGALLAWKKLKG